MYLKLQNVMDTITKPKVPSKRNIIICLFVWHGNCYYNMCEEVLRYIS